MSKTITTFLFELANFLVLAGALGWFFFKPLRQALANRRERLVSEEQQATRDREEVERIKHEIAEAHVQLRSELSSERAREMAAIRQQADAILADARSAAERELKSGQQQVDQLLKSREQRLSEAAAQAAAEVLSRLMKEINGPALQSALVQSAVEQLRLMRPNRLAPTQVESAGELNPQDRALLDSALGGAAATADYRINQDLGAGIRISTASGLIDASALGLAKFAQHSLSRSLNHQTNPDPLVRDVDHG